VFVSLAGGQFVLLPAFCIVHISPSIFSDVFSTDVITSASDCPER